MRSKDGIENTLKELKSENTFIKFAKKDEFKDGFIKALEWVLEME